jgi:hypothetical protein
MNDLLLAWLVLEVTGGETGMDCGLEYPHKGYRPLLAACPAVRRGSGTGRTWSGITTAPGMSWTVKRATCQTVATGPVARQQAGEPTLLTGRGDAPLEFSTRTRGWG